MCSKNNSKVVWRCFRGLPSKGFMYAIKHVLEETLNTSPEGFQRLSKTSERSQKMYRETLGTRIYECVRTLLCLGVEQGGSGTDLWTSSTSNDKLQHKDSLVDCQGAQSQKTCHDTMRDKTAMGTPLGCFQVPWSS